MIPLVLLPGMMCDARQWGPQCDSLLPRPIVALPPPDLETMQEMAAHLLGQLPPRFALAGLSMGGILAMEMVRQAPARVDRLALLDTNPLAETDAVRARRAPQIARVLAGDLAGVMRDEMKPNYLARHDAALLDLCLDMAVSLGPSYFVSQSRALASRPDQTATLAAWRGPALVLTGAQDTLCPRDRHDLMHRLMPQSRLVVVPDAGHLPPLEQPQATTAALIPWLED